MLDRFLNNVEEKRLFESNQKVLLAISGGIDSMVLLHLFEKSGFDYGIAHCNFQLRGNESDLDEEFVRKQVLIHGVPAFFEKFDTEEYAKLSGISIEMAARELRYDFFEKIRIENNFDFIVTAHHQDDLIETFFLNLSRKTGIKGLTGIKVKSRKIIRPLLFADRVEIENYASLNYIDFREDSSNNEVVFQRNFLRHKILPLFSELNPAFKKNILASIENLKDAEKVYSGFLSSEKAGVIVKNKNETEIKIQALIKSSFPKILLLEILSEFNFNATVVDEIFKSLSTESGKQFFSKTHRLVKDRNSLFVSTIKENGDKIYYIEKDDIELFEPLDISIEKFPSENFQIVKEPSVACLDLDQIEFPLLIRKWQQGDYFQPLGMTGFKKISDFFIDQKIPIHEKENTWILCSGKKIVWIMGHRIDNRFKINDQTNNILKIEIK
ncbi:MAG: tRNA lysidine(34) synthetase TilS [Prolixibacteraceae bacterium]|jgi:tRNA(Ile)-lysidine synthase|nr:tRNA lysidine(34) synthetase TilS [Prolixibacteraceae bacterium]MBT7000619.1 tRNA lysidine(34) synthetase TilS [Prolixibacteraceae bacterium]MBT7395551.1 tRNA lysidine(34) synthetase TilS [Prolixibacteraceae bacterium]